MKINKQNKNFKSWSEYLNHDFVNEKFTRVARKLLEMLENLDTAPSIKIDYSITVDKIYELVTDTIHELNDDNALDLSHWSDDDIESALAWRIDEVFTTYINTDDIVDTLGLTEDQVKWLKHYASAQYPGSDANMGTRFPVIYHVYDYELLTASSEDYDKIYYGYDFRENGYSNMIIREKRDDLKEFANERQLPFDEDNIEQVYIRIRRIDKAVFLTKNAAEDYMKYQKHNLSSKAHVYADYIGYANYGDLEPLCRVLLKLGSVLNGTDPNTHDDRF